MANAFCSKLYLVVWLYSSRANFHDTLCAYMELSSTHRKEENRVASMTPKMSLINTETAYKTGAVMEVGYKVARIT